MKKILALLGMVGLLTFSQCDNTEKVGKDLTEVTFVADNLSLSPSSTAGLKTGIYTGMKGGEKSLPVCSDSEPSYVIIWINGEEKRVDILKDYGNGRITAMLKLPAGSYSITQFEVYNELDEMIWASPLEGSYYDELIGLEYNVEITFSIEPFDKTLVNVDVLCWQDYDYDSFGYGGFDVHYTKIKTICFFGDVCTKFYAEWHEDGSPYTGQPNPFHDFPAIFDVVITNDAGEIVNDLEVNSNQEYLGIGQPLCVEYTDDMAVQENYTATIDLVLPDGTTAEVGSFEFSDDDSSVEELNGGDGIVDFLVGGSDCLQDEPDAVFALPYVPLPNTVEFTLHYPASNSYFELVNIAPDVEAGEFTNGATLPAWCGNDTLHIHNGHRYLANVYPYYAIPDTSIYDLSDEKIAQIHYILNEGIGVYSKNTIQKAIWYIMGYASGQNNSLAQSASGITSYSIPVGGYMLVLVNPVRNITAGDDVDKLYQLAICKVDP